MNSKQMLYIFGGLPASGKSTLAKELASTIKAVYLRIDSIEEAILKNNKDVGPEGYEAAYSIAKENLENGISVVADSVNGIELTRKAWRKIAIDLNIEYKEICIICSNKEEHKKRLLKRNEKTESDRKLTWDEVNSRKFKNWVCVFEFDTANETINESKERFIKEINQLS